MNDVLLKYNELPPSVQEEVKDFLDALLSKHKGRSAFDMKGWKNKIKSVSTWTQEDIDQLEEGGKTINQLKVEEW
ncbi:DUF2281 domain-containing protein [Reichenbachiella ulvae]|uniref:DUF2281 domain-containing protein n=1 Tax=Reichenbachiella ulvae TaxID=2980104 RepID=A0ABT3CVI1_9BACT|nr:DUF2281 domain-containing protein [Reichenbachiella ulvae]MCV9387563.1 DUF2281 domain-containing protein [Reichenbachiella ulvae]